MTLTPEPQLTPQTCRECHKSILVAKWEPHPKGAEATGMAAYRWDEWDDTRFVGWICNECAWNSAMTTGGGTIAGGTEFIY
jgi:hypothetical protein